MNYFACESSDVVAVARKYIAPYHRYGAVHCSTNRIDLFPFSNVVAAAATATAVDPWGTRAQFGNVPHKQTKFVCLFSQR